MYCFFLTWIASPFLFIFAAFITGYREFFAAATLCTIPLTTHIVAKASEKISTFASLKLFSPYFSLLLGHYFLLHVAFKNVKTWH
jgi:hypothetical protein